MARRLTKRQELTIAELLFGDAGKFPYAEGGGAGGRPTQKQVAERFGISQAAISQRLARGVKAMSDDDRVRYLQCKGPKKPRHPKKNKILQLREEWM